MDQEHNLTRREALSLIGALFTGSGFMNAYGAYAREEPKLEILNYGGTQIPAAIRYKLPGVEGNQQLSIYINDRFVDGIDRFTTSGLRGPEGSFDVMPIEQVQPNGLQDLGDRRYANGYVFIKNGDKLTVGLDSNGNGKPDKNELRVSQILNYPIE